MSQFFKIDPQRGVVCHSCDRVIAATPQEVPQCPHPGCGVKFCPYCGAGKPDRCPLGAGEDCPLNLPS